MTTTICINSRSIHLLRILVSGIFIVAGFNHLFQLEKTVQKIENANFKCIAYLFGEPHWLIIASGLVMVIAGLLFLLGIKTKFMAILLIAILIPITFTVQVGQINTLGPLFKNIAILGALLFFVLNDINSQLKIIKNEKNTH